MREHQVTRRKHKPAPAEAQRPQKTHTTTPHSLRDTKQPRTAQMARHGRNKKKKNKQAKKQTNRRGEGEKKKKGGLQAGGQQGTPCWNTSNARDNGGAQ